MDHKGIRTLALIGVIAVQLGMATTAATSADAAPRQFFGMTTIGDPTAAELQRMGRGGVGTFRTNLYWPAVQLLGPEGHDWSRYDAIIGDAAASGLRVLPTFFGSPIWAAKKPHFPPEHQHLGAFEAFTAATAKRYGPNGDFWTDPALYRASHPGKPAIPIFDWQIWNEVNYPKFWGPRPHARQYKPVLAAARRGIKSSQPGPRSRIILSGLFRTPTAKHGVNSDTYLRQLYRAGARNLFDAVALHPYRGTPQLVIKMVAETRQLMRRHGDRRKPIWITEVGWATSGKRTGMTVKPKRQARYLRQTFRLAARSRGRLGIAGVIWFAFRDKQPRLWVYRTGLFTASMKPKPAWRAFTRLAGGRP